MPILPMDETNMHNLYAYTFLSLADKLLLELESSSTKISSPSKHKHIRSYELCYNVYY